MSEERQQKGQWAETLVKDFLTIRKHRILIWNCKTPWAQVDLLLQSPRGATYILEVKYQSAFSNPEQRLSYRQRQRLQRAREFLSEQLRTSIGLGLALVSPSGKIEFYNLDED